MNTMYVNFAGGSVEIVNTNETLRNQLEWDLSGFFNISDKKSGVQLLGRINFCSDPTSFSLIAEKVKSLPFRTIVMHNPKKLNDHRFGRLSNTGTDLVLHNTTKGSIYVIRDEGFQVDLYHTDLVAGAKEVRRLVRDQYFIRWLESKGAIVVHSASIKTSEGIVLVVGSSGSGKTSFFMSAAQSFPNSFPLVSEQNVLLSNENGVYCYPIPEKINFFPGTLRSFSETYELAESDSLEGQWDRSSKKFVHWQNIFMRFGIPIPTSSTGKISKIVFPKYISGKSYTSKPISAEETKYLLSQEVLTGAPPEGHNNWLCRFHHKNNVYEVVDTVSKIPAEQIFWSDIKDIAGSFIN